MTFPADTANLSRFCRALGWPAPRRFTREAAPGALSDGAELIEWFEARDAGVWLQVNRRPGWCACVYALRFRLCSGRHAFDLQPATLKPEVARLRPWLARSWFASPEARQAYRRAHPECARYTWRKLRETGSPHICTYGAGDIVA